MENLKFADNILELGSQQVIFNKKIVRVRQIKDLYIVLLEANGEVNNVYAVNQSAKIIWRIQSAPKEMVGNARLPYIGINIADNGLGAVDFLGRRYTIDIQDGSITGFEVVK